jgi:predicted tellurium resistance membrane protein TerC
LKAPPNITLSYVRKGRFVFGGRNPVICFIEIIIGVVTFVWTASFFADIFSENYDASQINNIFLVVVGSGMLTRTLAAKALGNDTTVDEGTA